MYAGIPRAPHGHVSALPLGTEGIRVRWPESGTRSGRQDGAGGAEGGPTCNGSRQGAGSELPGVASVTAEEEGDEPATLLRTQTGDELGERVSGPFVREGLSHSAEPGVDSSDVNGSTLYIGINLNNPISYVASITTGAPPELSTSYTMASPRNATIPCAI
jgi:hypothetical protein